ncbi:hypothetical protein SRHO_G00018970 [Serrasalmus rhombeus]
MDMHEDPHRTTTEQRTQTKLVYENELVFRPKPRPHPAVFTYPVVCTFERPEWIRPFLKPGFRGLQGQGSFIFHMALLNDDLSGPAPSNSFPMGSFIHVWAAVEQKAHQPLMLYLEECVASTTQTLGPEVPIYPIITNKGCLVDSKTGYSRFLPRYHSSAVVLRLQAFNFALEQEVYLHCSMVVWDPEYPNEVKKACNYNKDVEQWELLDDPSMSDLCSCCEYRCFQRVKRGLQSEFQGLAQSVVLGPLTITASPSSNGSPIQDAFTSAYQVFVDCGESSVSVRWSERQSLTEPWLLRLGDCPPLSVSVRPGGAEAVFHARFDDCGFRRLVTENEIVFENELSSEASSQSPSDFSCPIVCAYERPAEWSPPMYDPASFWVNGRGDLVFRMSFMNDDFSDVAPSTTFFLGTLIPIAAAVEQQAHQPLVLLLEECVASASPDPSQDSSVYSIIANKGSTFTVNLWLGTPKT